MSGRPVPIIPKVDHPQENCSWCWYTMHPLIPFPPDRSSTCCPEHCAWIITDHAHKREARASRTEVWKPISEREGESDEQTMA